MNKIMLLAFILLAFGINTASAIPTLQLYLPDGAYYDTNPWFPDSEDSWVTTSNPFKLQVAGAKSPAWVNTIDNVKLDIAVLKDQYPSGIATPLVTITDNDPNINFQKILYASDFSFGMPEELSRHGIYNTYFASVELPDLLAGTAGEAIYDYNADFDPSNPQASGSRPGDIQYYSIDYDPRFTLLHLDITGTIHRGLKSYSVFAPYSHDADSNVIPEPATLALLGLGFIGIFAGKRKVI